MLSMFLLNASVWVSVSCALFIYGLCAASKYFLRRIRLARELPGTKIGLLNFLGDIKNFQKNLPPKLSNCRNINSLQIVSAYTQLFRSKMLFCFWLTYTPVVYVVKAQAIEELISGTKNLEKSWFYDWMHPWLQTGLLTSSGQRWKSRRKLLTPCFHFEILKDFLPTINEKSQMLVDILRKETQRDWTDVTPLLSLCTLDVICETTLGVNINAQENSKSEYVEANTRLSSIVIRRMEHPKYFVDWLFNLSDMGREFRKDVTTIHNFTQSVIRQKKAKLQHGKRTSIPGKRKALMDVLLEHHLKDGDLTENDICEEVTTFAFAGHDTTATSLKWALYLIGLYKDVQDRIHEELDDIFGDDEDRPITPDDLRSMEYLDRVLKECQRLYPSVPVIGRRSGAGNVLNGYKIPEGIAVGVFIYELHRDPEVFPDPEKFDPDRFLPQNSANRHPYAYIPFSAGPRNCVGQRFAVMEEKVIIADILRNYTVESLDPRDKVVLIAEMILRTAEPIRIRIRNR